MVMPAYLEQGEGDTAVFLLHGVGGGKEAWAHNQPVLAGQGFRTVAWDMPGYGASPPLSPCTNVRLADALKTLIEHVGAKRNVLLGHSMGGMIAQELAALHPALVHGLILYSTSPAFGKADGALMARVPAESYRAALSAIVSFNRLAALGDIAVPTLCLAGELDLNAPPAVVEKMAGRIPGAAYVCLPQVGHIANIEQPALFNHAVLAFLNQHLLP